MILIDRGLELLLAVSAALTSLRFILSLFGFLCTVAQHSSLAQSVERMTVNHDVTGSSPVRGATNEKP